MITFKAIHMVLSKGVMILSKIYVTIALTVSMDSVLSKSMNDINYDRCVYDPKNIVIVSMVIQHFPLSERKIYNDEERVINSQEQMKSDVSNLVIC